MDILININPEFKDFIPPLSPEEYKNLEESILEEGCKSPIILWEKTNEIIDGHHRYEICSKHGIEFNVEFREFDSIPDVEIWMVKNQLGRRNLSDHAKLMLRGKISLELGSRERGQHGENFKSPTRKEICAELGVKTPKSLREAEQYFESVSQIQQKIDPEINKKMQEDPPFNREEIIAIAKIADEDLDLAKKIYETPRPLDGRKLSPAFKEECRRIREFLNANFPSIQEQWNLANCLDKWKSILDIHLGSDKAWEQIRREILELALKKEFSSVQTELSQRAKNLGLPSTARGLTNKLERSSSNRPREREEQLERPCISRPINTWSDKELLFIQEQIKQELSSRKISILAS